MIKESQLKKKKEQFKYRYRNDFGETIEFTASNREELTERREEVLKLLLSFPDLSAQ